MFDWQNEASLGGNWPAQIDLTYIYIFAVMTMTYVLIRPIIKWIIMSKSVRLLNYVMASLLFLVLLLSGIILTAALQLSLLTVTLQTLAVFGGCLGMIHIMQFIMRRKTRRPR